MSIYCLNWALERKTGSAPKKAVLVLLGNYADEQCTCYPGIDVLAEKTELGKSTVRKALAALQRDGFIRVLQRWGRRGGRRSNRYQLMTQGPDTPMPDHGDWTREFRYALSSDGAGDLPDDADDFDVDLADDMESAASTIADQGQQSAPSEHLAPGERFKPPAESTSRGSDVAPSYKEDPKAVIPQKETTPPAPLPSDAAAAVVPQQRGEGSSPMDAAAAANFAAVAQRRPDWSGAAVRKAVDEAARRGLGDLVHCSQVMLDLAVDPRTRVPGRLLADGPWWDQPVQASPSPARRAADSCPKHQGQVAGHCSPCKAEALGVADRAPDRPLTEDAKRYLAEVLRRRAGARIHGKVLAAA